MHKSKLDNFRRPEAAWREVREHMARLLAQSESFAALGQKLNIAPTPIAAARVIVKAADKLLGWDACTVSLYSRETDSTSPVLIIDPIGGRREEGTAGILTTRPTAPTPEVLSEGGAVIFVQKAGFAPGWA